jgi:hypothetical protein
VLLYTGDLLFDEWFILLQRDEVYIFGRANISKAVIGDLKQRFACCLFLLP